MIHIVLYQPEIPPNTGNIIRLCANCGAQLHLIEPMGFALEDKQLRRAGLDYHEWANICRYKDFNDFQSQHPNARLIAATTHGTQSHTHFAFAPDDMLLFGPESRGLPADIIEKAHAVRIPMRPHSRSLNLSNAVAIITYEAIRQLAPSDLS